MTIKEIAYKLNTLASKGEHEFSKIQEIRKKHGINPRTRKPFAAFSIKDSYAFHAGGRKEFQFNIGKDELDGEIIFRYGLAFSLNEDKTLNDYKAEFKSKVERFNKFFSTNPNFFKGFKLWYYSNENFVKYFDEVRVIDDKMFQAENFIFIGKFFNKVVDEISEIELETVLTTFDYLIPIYETVQFGKIENEKRIARLCWNNYGWVMPSGRYGKSRYKDSHEAKVGYGHEEWLFDIGKLVDGYHYGFLEPIRKQQDAYSDNVYDIWLYTIDEETKKRYWIGEIKNVEVLNKRKANEIKEEYINRQWLSEMKEQIKVSGASPKRFVNSKGIDLFNVCFRPSALKLNDPYFEIPRDHPINKLKRYTFAYFKREFNLYKEDNEGFTFIPSTDDDDDDGKPRTKTHVREPRTIEIVYLHEAISKSLTKKLRKQYGKENVTREHKAGYGANRIDIVVKDGDDFIFYEIKTYPMLRTSIREAIGQLMEYSLWTNHKKAKQLIVVTQPHNDFENAKIYFKHLRDTYSLPLNYQFYDSERDILSEIV